MNSFDFSQVPSPDWARTNRSGIVFGGTPLCYRFDGQRGQFRIGTEEFGDEMMVRPFLWRWKSGVRWGRPAQAWFDLAFVDADGIVSVLSLNKGSAINIYSDLCQMQRAALNPMAHRLLLAATDATVTLVSEDGEEVDAEYCALRVAHCEPVALHEYGELQDFVKKYAFEWVLAGEVTE